MNTFNLVPDPDMRLQIERGATGNFAYLYTDELGAPIANAVVRFAIVGHANDASLLATEGTTDENGRVMGSVIGSSTETSFRVRGTADNADSAFVDVSVSNAGYGSIQIDIAYTGTRPVVDYVVRLYGGILCNMVSSANGSDRYERMRDSDSSITFEGLPAGISYALVVQGQDRDHITLATQCVDRATITADETRVVPVTLEDVAARLSGDYELEFTFATDAPGLRAQDQIVASANAYYRDNGAAFLLDQVNALIGTDATALSTWQDYRASMYVDSMVASYLETHEAGTAQALAEVGAFARDGIAQITFVAALNVPENGAIARDGLRFTAFEAMDGARIVPIAATLVPAPTTLAQGSYSMTMPGALEVESFDFNVALGALTRAYIEGAFGRDLRAVLIDAAQCSVLADWWSASSLAVPVCTAETIERACSRAIETIADATLVSLANLDVSQRTLNLHGIISGDDSNRDGEVDTLGASTLSGWWRPAGATMGVAADMRVVGTRLPVRRSTSARP